MGKVVKKSKEISHEEIEDAMSRFLKKGGVINKIEYNDIGFVKNDTLPFYTEPPQINYIFAKRNTNMITNVLSLNYILSNKIDLAVKLRYHLDQIKNLEFNHLCLSSFYFLLLLFTLTVMII